MCICKGKKGYRKRSFLVMAAIFIIVVAIVALIIDCCYITKETCYHVFILFSYYSMLQERPILNNKLTSKRVSIQKFTSI